MRLLLYYVAYWGTSIIINFIMAKTSPLCNYCMAWSMHADVIYYYIYTILIALLRFPVQEILLLWLGSNCMNMQQNVVYI